MTKTIVIDEKKCVGCKSCVFSCAMVHSEGRGVISSIRSDAPPVARIYIEPLALDDECVPMRCRHCPEPACAAVCPKDAISKRESDGAVLIDAALCIGCKFCVLACPFGAIEMSSTKPKEAKALKCDACIELIGRDELPACAEACPTKAITFQENTPELLGQLTELIDGTFASLREKSEGKTDSQSAKAVCQCCGQEYAPKKLIENIAKKMPEGTPMPTVCPSCRRKSAAAIVAEKSKKSKESKESKKSKKSKECS